MFSAAKISHAINLAKVNSTQDRSQTVAPPSVLLMLVSEMRHNARIPMEEILTPEEEFMVEFEDDLPSSPWNEPNPGEIDELDLVVLEGSDEFKAHLR